MFNRKKYEQDAVNLYRSTNAAILSTMSKKYEGYPFGSFITYATDKSRTLFMYTSDIAQHTKNLKNDSKACVTLFKLDTEYDKQNSSRLTLMGDLKKVPKDDLDDCQERFVKFLPESKKYSSMHDFKFYKLEISRVRWIGGFGDIAWINPKNWKDDSPKWSKNEKMMIDHMNDDHANVIQSALHAQHDIKDKKALMIALTIDGYYVKSKEKIYFISFDAPVFKALDYRKTLVKQAKDYRSFEL
tara:strand:+ start:1330 stop:2058 length:729 start_codon:yes stop_codon:yes gene_type:complete